MHISTRVILAVLGLLVGILVVYYGFMMPAPSAGQAADIAPSSTLSGDESNAVASEEDDSQARPSLVPIDEGTTRPRGMFSSPLSSGGLDSEGLDSSLSGEPQPTPTRETAGVVTDPTMSQARPGETNRESSIPVSQREAPTLPVDYTIREGDTLMSIAASWLGDAYGWDLIARANPGLDPRKLRIGQRIVLPPRGEKVATKQPAPRSSFVYTVMAGDTLSDLAARYYDNGGLWERIYSANRLTMHGDPNTLKVGMKLVIPPGP